MNISVPKKLHYVWVGTKDVDSDVAFMENYKSWKKHFKGFEFYFWNNDKVLKKWGNISYVKNAYLNKKWANISNLVRLLALYEFGGVYLDTDIKVLKGFGKLMFENCVFGFQLKEHPSHWVNDAVIISKRRHWIIKDIISEILNTFDGEESSDLSAPVVVTKVLKENGLNIYLDKGVLVKGVKVLPVECFYPYSWEEKFSNNCIKENTYAIHYWNKEW